MSDLQLDPKTEARAQAFGAWVMGIATLSIVACFVWMLLPASEESEARKRANRAELAEWAAKREAEDQTRRANAIVYEEMVREQVRRGLR